MTDYDDAIREIQAVADADHKAERLRSFGLPSREEVMRDDAREPINIHPGVAGALRALLMRHPRYETSGIGYSEFIRRAVERELEDA